MGQYLKETLLRSSKSENDDEKHHQVVEILRDEKMEGWANDEKNLKDLGEIHMTDDESFLRQNFEKNLRIAPDK